MQTIYKANHHTRFSFVGSDFCNSKIPSDAKNVLLYLIDKPIDWKLIVKNIANTLDLSVYAVRKALRWLLDHGYASYKRLSDGRTIWQIFEQPKQAENPAMTPRVEIPNVETQHDIHITQTSPITQKPQQRAPEPEPITAPAKQDVVVPDEVIDQVVIPHIPCKHQPTARQSLLTLSKVEADSVLCAFTLAMSKGSVQNPTGYLLQLVKASKSGTFSPVQAQQATPTPSLSERLAKERQRQQEAQERGRMTNEEHADWLRSTYGVAGSSGTSITARLAKMREGHV